MDLTMRPSVEVDPVTHFALPPQEGNRDFYRRSRARGNVESTRHAKYPRARDRAVVARAGSGGGVWPDEVAREKAAAKRLTR